MTTTTPITKEDSAPGALFEKVSDASQITFPAEPAFVVPVKVKAMPETYGEGQCGVIAAAPIPAKTKIWVWTDRVKQISPSQLEDYLELQANSMISRNDRSEESLAHDQKMRRAKQTILRQGFVLPAPNDQLFNSNPTDAGRFMNHSSTPNCGPDGTLFDVAAGEELTMDYAFHGDPKWYQDICKKYGVLTEAQVAAQSRKS